MQTDLNIVLIRYKYCHIFEHHLFDPKINRPKDLHTWDTSVRTGIPVSTVWFQQWMGQNNSGVLLQSHISNATILQNRQCTTFEAYN